MCDEDEVFQNLIIWRVLLPVSSKGMQVLSSLRCCIILSCFKLFPGFSD